MNKEDRYIEPGTYKCQSNYKIVIDIAGPILVYGSPPMNKLVLVPDKHNHSSNYKEIKKISLNKSPVSLCRCGASKNKPFCDGSHIKTEWDSTLTSPITQAHKHAKYYEGKTIALQNNKELCSCIGFCKAGVGIWNLIKKETGRQEDIKTIKNIINLCPSGSLRLWDRVNITSLEEPIYRSISLIDDNINNVSGPIWIKGGITIDSNNGMKFELRNRVTLCRCGSSKNKPFCDGKHIQSQFKDEIY